MMDVTRVQICWACLSAIKATLETFKLRDYQRDQPQGHYTDGAIRSEDLQKAFKQEKADDSDTMHNSKHSPKNDMEIYWGFSGEDSAEEYFAGCCRLQLYANTATTKTQITIEEAKGAQS